MSDQPLPPLTASASWRVGKFRIALTAHMPPGSTVLLSMTWTPEPEKKLTNAELRLYRKGRDRALLELANALDPFVTLTH